MTFKNMEGYSPIIHSYVRMTSFVCELLSHVACMVKDVRKVNDLLMRMLAPASISRSKPSGTG